MDNKAENKETIKWYYKPLGILIAILCVGPLAIPLVMLSPAFTKKQKIMIIVATIVFTLALIKITEKATGVFLDQWKELNSILNG